MKTYLALIKREVLEHRGAFVYAPSVLLIIVFLTALLATTFGDAQFASSHDFVPTDNLFTVLIAGIFAVWTAYITIALVFYFGDSFSADSRNNSLLFWKSMPQSDLKILMSKALTAVTAFPIIIILYAFLSGIFAYVVLQVVAVRIPFIQAPSIFEALTTWVQMEIVGVSYLVLSVLWYAPFFAWVAGLSVVFQRWSIPLAILTPGVIILIEKITSWGSANKGQPIAKFLAHRLDGIEKNLDIFDIVTADAGYSPFTLLGDILIDIDWLNMIVGLVFALVLIYLASEYRRRRTVA